jgi:hypothetical protein
MRVGAYPRPTRSVRYLPSKLWCSILAARRRMDQELEDLVARAADPRWIPAIYEYCDRRCARCRFSDRCFRFAEQTRDDCSGEDVGEAVAASLQRALHLLHALAEREGIDKDQSTSPTDDAMDTRIALVDDPLVTKARQYGLAAHRLLQALEAGEEPRTASPEVREAIESILWLCTSISSKVFRAVASLERPFSPDDHPTQNDAHGSAKVARLMIAESLAAWRVLNEAGCAPIDSPTRTIVETLERIDQDLSERIPRAMEFVRPGFDEPIPGSVRPWSLAVDDERGDRRLLAAEGILTKLGAFGRRFWRR